MSDQFVEEAQKSMGAIERLLKGLPGISGYVDKEMRRDADERLRNLIARQLEEQKQALLDVQQSLLRGGGLKWLDDVDGAVNKLQLLIDRITTAASGYAGFFDTVRIGKDQLKALHNFDVALAERTSGVQNVVTALATAVQNNGEIGAIVKNLTNLIAELNNLFLKREEAIIDPGLLTAADFTPMDETPKESAGSEAKADDPYADAVG